MAGAGTSAASATSGWDAGSPRRQVSPSSQSTGPTTATGCQHRWHRPYQQLIVDEDIERVTARMTEDWLDAVSALAALGLMNGANVSVFGMSMGARFGLPVAAALESRLRCAVLGKFGIRQTDLIHPGLCAPSLIAAAARSVSAPVLYHVQWNDAIFPREGQFELFDALASVDKHLVARSGTHAETHPDDEASWPEFIRTHAPGADSHSLPAKAGTSPPAPPARCPPQMLASADDGTRAAS